MDSKTCNSFDCIEVIENPNKATLECLYKQKQFTGDKLCRTCKKFKDCNSCKYNDSCKGGC